MNPFLLLPHSTIMAINFNCATEIHFNVFFSFLPLAAVTFLSPTLVPLPPPLSLPLPFSFSGYCFRFMSDVHGFERSNLFGVTVALSLFSTPPFFYPIEKTTFFFLILFLGENFDGFKPIKTH